MLKGSVKAPLIVHKRFCKIAKRQFLFLSVITIIKLTTNRFTLKLP